MLALRGGLATIELYECTARCNFHGGGSKFTLGSLDWMPRPELGVLHRQIYASCDNENLLSTQNSWMPETSIISSNAQFRWLG
ncbi:hypothetical protein VTL71DRAFT_11748, partial [Oculimacula yallundae]